MAIILLILGICIILYNLIASFSNMGNVIRYCLDTHTLHEFWPYVFKHCFSFRAIYSGIFVLISALLIFLLLVPIVLTKKMLFKSKVEKALSGGEFFDYTRTRAHADVPIDYTTNLEEFGFSAKDIAITANIENDLYSVIDAIGKQCESRNAEFRYTVNFENYIIEKDKSIVVPLMLFINDDPFPVYFIYDEFQKDQYNKVSAILLEGKFRNCVYFFTVKMD